MSTKAGSCHSRSGNVSRGTQRLRASASGRYMEVKCTADLEPLVEFGIVPKAVARLPPDTASSERQWLSDMRQCVFHLRATDVCPA